MERINTEFPREQCVHVSSLLLANICPKLIKDSCGSFWEQHVSSGRWMDGLLCSAVACTHFIVQSGRNTRQPSALNKQTHSKFKSLLLVIAGSGCNTPHYLRSQTATGGGLKPFPRRSHWVSTWKKAGSEWQGNWWDPWTWETGPDVESGPGRGGKGRWWWWWMGWECRLIHLCPLLLWNPSALRAGTEWISGSTILIVPLTFLRRSQWEAWSFSDLNGLREVLYVFF